jgi:hypothetical protein
MTHSIRIRRTIGIAEISALILGTLGIVASEMPQPAVAAPAAPYVISATAMLPGTNITSPWVADFAGSASWAIGVNGSGSGVLIRRDSATGVFTSSAMEADETAATAGTAVLGSNYIAFVVSLKPGGARIVVLDTVTRLRVSSAALPASAFGSTAIGSSSQGYVFIVTPGSPTSILKVTVATGLVASTVSIPAASSPAASAITRAGSLYVMTATTPAKTVIVKTNPGTVIESTTSLAATAPNLYSPVVGLDGIWYATATTPGRIIGFNTSSKSVVADFSGPAGSVGVTALTLDPSRVTAWYTTTISGSGVLVNMRLSDGAILSTTPLPSTINPHSLVVSEHTVDVMSAVNAHVTRFAIITPPEAPIGVAVLDRSEGITVSWNPVTSSGAPVRYTVSVVGNGYTGGCETAATMCDVGGLVNGIQYSVRVRAISVVGFADSAPASARPARLPDPPSALTATRGNQSIDITWTPGDDGGRPVERFLVVANPGNHTCITTAHRCTIGGLTNGVHYAISVRAETELGASPQLFTAEPVMPATLPSSPVHLTTRSEGRNRTIVVCAPNDAGGFRDASLRARIVRNGVPGDSFRPSTSSTIRIGGNTFQPLAIEIHAVNAVGASPPITIPIDTNPVFVKTSRSSQRSMATSCDRRSMAFEIRP